MDITGAVKQAQKVTPLLTSIALAIVLGVIVVGVLVYQVDSGNISIPSTLQTFINGTLLTSLVSAFTAPVTVVTTVIALLIVVALIVLFRGFMGGSKGKQM